MAPDECDLSSTHAATLGEGALAQSSERYASMFTHHPHAAYSVDEQGVFTDANDRALEMAGMPLDEMRQAHFAQVVHPDDLHRMQTAFEGALAGQPQLIDARVVSTDGAVKDIRCTAIPVIVDGEVVGVHGIAEDVTEANHLVRQLEEANAAKTLFLATVSHEVRTPLAVLVGATDLLMDLELGPEPAHYAHMVQRSSQRLMDLVDDILEFSGLEAHQTMLHRRPFELRAVVEDVAEWAVPLAESHGLAISLVVDESVPTTAVGDGRRVTQVVTNLVQNAITFTEAGSVDVRVRSRAAAPGPDGDPGVPGSWVEFTVTDTGIGITEDHVQRLFRPFAQAEAAGDHKGVGLGLAISRELVDLMGGQLQVSSTLGEGSTFVFGVPLGHVAEDHDGQARTTSSTSS